MATYYFDYTNGDDANSGTYSSPWKNLPGSNDEGYSLTPAAGDTYYLKRGETWDLFLAGRGYLNWSMSGTLGSPITWTSYYSAVDGSDDITQPLPVIKNLWEWIGESWSQYSGNIYQATASFAESTGGTVLRAWIDDTPYLVAANADAVDADTPWFVNTATKTFYVYSPSNNPVTDYSSIQCAMSVNSRTSNVYMVGNGRTYVDFNNISFVGGVTRGAQIACDSSANTENINFYNCQFSYFGLYGITYDGNDDTYKVKNCVVNNCTFTGNTSTHENKSVDSYPYGKSAITIEGNIDNITVSNCTITDMRHTNLEMSPEASRVISNVNFFDCQHYWVISDYGRAFSFAATATDNIINCSVQRNYISGQMAQSKASGTNIKVLSNIWINSSWSGGYANNNGYSLMLKYKAATLLPDNCIIANNLFINGTEPAINLAADGASMPADAYIIRNNIMIGNGTGWSTEGVQFYDDAINGGTQVDQIVENNIMYYDGVATTLVDYNGTPQTISTYESTNTLAANNLSTNPLLDSNYKPTIDSPTIEAGTTVNQFARDYNSRPFKIPPTIGAYEVTSGFPAQTRTPRT